MKDYQYSKDKSNIVASFNGKFIACYNIYTGQFYGKTGKPLAHTPSAFGFLALNTKRNHSDHDRQTRALADWAIKMIHRRPYFSHEEDYKLWLEAAEKLMSVGLLSVSSATVLIEQSRNFKLNKENVELIQQFYNGYYRDIFVTFPTLSPLLQKIAQSYTGDAKVKRQKTICDLYGSYAYVTNSNEQEVADKILPFLDKMEKEFLFAMDNGGFVTGNYSELAYIPLSLSSLIGHFITASQRLYNQISFPERNIMTNFYIQQSLLKQLTEKQMQDNLASFDDKRLYYENEEYVFYPLTTIEQFHDEATQQDNCVERLYLKPVSEHHTHVVVCRRKDNIEQSFITCEVGLNGNIFQFLLSHNRHISQELQWLKDEYSNHLAKQFT